MKINLTKIFLILFSLISVSANAQWEAMVTYQTNETIDMFLRTYLSRVHKQSAEIIKTNKVKKCICRAAATGEKLFTVEFEKSGYPSRMTELNTDKSESIVTPVIDPNGKLLISKITLPQINLEANYIYDKSRLQNIQMRLNSNKFGTAEFSYAAANDSFPVSSNLYGLVDTISQIFNYTYAFGIVNVVVENSRYKNGEIIIKDNEINFKNSGGDYTYVKLDNGKIIERYAFSFGLLSDEEREKRIGIFNRPGELSFDETVELFKDANYEKSIITYDKRGLPSGGMFTDIRQDDWEVEYIYEYYED